MKVATILFAFLLAAASGVQAQGMAMPMQPAASAAAKSAAPLVDAEVKKVDAARGHVLLKHGEIPNLNMGPMTMSFDVADRKMLKGLKAGQKVQFRAEMVAGKATVTEMKRKR